MLADVVQLDSFVSGILGAFLLFAASFFVDVGLAVRASWWRPILFVGVGGITSMSLGLDGVYGLMTGAGWPYVAVSLKKGAEAFGNGVRTQASAAGRAYFEGRYVSAKEKHESLTKEEEKKS